MKTTLIYYVKCNGKVHFTSVQYHEAVAYRDELATAAADQPGMCQKAHAIQHRNVDL